jgi:hypothetical protein
MAPKAGVKMLTSTITMKEFDSIVKNVKDQRAQFFPDGAQHQIFLTLPRHFSPQEIQDVQPHLAKVFPETNFPTAEDGVGKFSEEEIEYIKLGYLPEPKTEEGSTEENVKKAIQTIKKTQQRAQIETLAQKAKKEYHDERGAGWWGREDTKRGYNELRDEAMKRWGSMSLEQKTTMKNIKKYSEDELKQERKEEQQKLDQQKAEKKAEKSRRYEQEVLAAAEYAATKLAVHVTSKEEVKTTLKEFTIWVRPFSGKDVPIVVKSSFSVAKLKAMVSSDTKVPKQKFSLVHESKTLYLTQSISEHGLKSDSHVTMTGYLAGEATNTKRMYFFKNNNNKKKKNIVL